MHINVCNIIIKLIISNYIMRTFSNSLYIFEIIAELDIKIKQNFTNV